MTELRYRYTRTLGTGISIIILVAIVCLTAVSITALVSGVDGAIVASLSSMIVGLPTFVITRLFYKKGE